MKTLVIHKAKQNHGKTGSLDCLIQNLCSEPDFELLYPSGKDEITAFMIGRYSEHAVGIITFGDPGYEKTLHECLDVCVSYKCDVIISASRTKWGVYDMLNDFADENGYDIIETAPIYVSRCKDDDSKTLAINQANKLTANMIISVLKSLLV